MSCKACENRFDRFDNTRNIEYSEQYGIFLLIERQDYDYMLDEWTYCKIPIEHCPFCGELLTKENS